MVEEIIKKAVIKKLPGKEKWQVLSEKGKNLGTYDSKEKAEKRLKQVEYFKHLDKKKRKADLTLNYFKKASEETPTYSAMMRELNKKKNPELREEFMRKFKDAFDQAMEQELEDAQTLALMEAKKSLGSDINYRLLSFQHLMKYI